MGYDKICDKPTERIHLWRRRFLFHLSDSYASLDTKKEPLIEIDIVVPWEEFRAALDRTWSKPKLSHKFRAGRNASRPKSSVVINGQSKPKGLFLYRFMKCRNL